jgi:uncharacterized protein (DUF885 family)
MGSAESSRKAKEQLAEKFNLKAFHGQILNDGVTPLDLLQEAWTKQQVARKN